MSGAPAANPGRLDELLADRALWGLPAVETSELNELLRVEPDADPEDLDRVAAVLAVLLADPEIEPMPARLRERVQTDAVGWLARSRGLAVAGAPPAAPPATPAAPTWLPWLAAAACLTLAVVSWWPSRDPDLQAVRAGLLAGAPDVRQIAWQPTEGATGSGDVVWSTQRQEGVLRFRQVPPNDPSMYQYQLWIFDARRKTYNAVDGGVFDIDRSTGEVLVSIRPTLHVFEPTLFAITTEPPGGVVKHDPELDPVRFRIVMTAPVPEAS